MLRVQVPSFHVLPQFFPICPHTEIYHQAFAAGIRRGNLPHMPRPFKSAVQRKFRSCPVSAPVSPEVSVKVYLPLRWGLLGLRVQVHIVEFFRILDFTVIKMFLQRSDIVPRPLHGAQLQFLPKVRQHALLFFRRRIVPEKAFKLRLVPLPRLHRSRRIAAGKNQPQEFLEIVRNGVNKVRRGIHGAHRKHHIAKAPNETKVDTVHPCPAEYRRALRRTEIQALLLPTLYSHSRQIQPAA